MWMILKLILSIYANGGLLGSVFQGFNDLMVERFEKMHSEYDSPDFHRKSFLVIKTLGY